MHYAEMLVVILLAMIAGVIMNEGLVLVGVIAMLVSIVFAVAILSRTERGEEG